MKKKTYPYIVFCLIFLLAGGICFLLAGCGHREEETAAPQEEATGISNANEKYPNANDSMVYFINEEGEVEQWSLYGIYQNTYSLGKEELDQNDLLYVDNDEILWLDYHYKSDRYVVMRTPIQKTKSGERLNKGETEKLFTIADDICPYGASGGYDGLPGAVVANDGYVTYCSYGGFYAYDREDGKICFSKEDCFFTPYALSAMSGVCGDQILFSSGRSSVCPGDESYELSIYRFGERKARTIDTRCFSQAAYVADPVRNKVYYQIQEDQSIWEYDCRTERKREFITEEQLQACYKKYGLVWDEAYFDDALFVDGNDLYFVKDRKNPLIFSCDLTKPSLSLCYESEWTGLIRNRTAYVQSNEWAQRLAILEGRLLLYWSECKEEEEFEYYASIDRKTKTGKLVGKSGWLFQVQDPDMIYFALIGCWEEPGTTGELRELSYKEKQGPDAVPKTARELSDPDQLQLFSSQAEQWMGKDMEVPYEYYAVTDLDQNGKLELIASTGTEGSGAYTSSDYFQVAADGVSLRKCRIIDADFGGWSEPDIVDGIHTAYVNPDTGDCYYLTSDYCSGGAGARSSWRGALRLKNGCLSTCTISSMFEAWNKKGNKIRYLYYKMENGKMKKISRKEYKPEKFARQYFAGFEKKKVTILWVRFHQKRKNITEKDILKKLTKSYEAFALRSE